MWDEKNDDLVSYSYTAFLRPQSSEKADPRNKPNSKEHALS